MAKARAFSRLDRVSASVRRILAAPLNDLARSRAGALVTVTEVKLSPDLRHAAVYLSVYGTEGAEGELLATFAGHAGELQAMLADKLRMKRTPVLSFELDDRIERADRIARLLHPAGRDGGASSET